MNFQQKNFHLQKYTNKDYICPSCQEKQTSLTCWQTASIAYDYDLATKNWEEKDIEGGEFESWNCPSCGAELLLDKNFLN